jgi:hypothetical protein
LHQNLIGWKLAAPNALNSQAFAYDVRLSWFPQSVDVYKLAPKCRSAGVEEIAIMPTQSGTQLLRECKVFHGV